MFRFLVCICIFTISVDSARILGVFPVPSISHQVVFRALNLELAKRGHELVIITPNPALPKDRPPDNVTEIDVSFTYDRIAELFKEGQKEFARGVVMDPDLQLTTEAYTGMLNMFVEVINHPEVKKITEDKSQKFDLIIAESYLNYHLIVSEIFKAPMILFTSLHGFPQSFEAVGAITQHPTLFPTVYSDVPDEYTIITKMKRVKYEFDYYYVLKDMDAIENYELKKNFGPDAPTVEKLRSNTDMLFINSNPIFCNNKPLPPNAVYVGPLHLNPSKALPEELQSYLDKSKTGVIYVSFGTNVRTSFMDKDFLYALVEAFRELPYDILWKYDDDSIENLPKNVKIQKWFPQRDLLLHPNVKLFIMQGGLQSTDEAIDAGVPLVGIPMLGDQYYNVHKYVQLGIGVRVDGITMDKESLLKGINTVLKDKRYKNNMMKLKKIMNDHPQKPLDRAVWWTEYVIRHGGARHFRPPTANISWSELLVADVAAVVFAGVLAIIITMLLVIRCIVAIFFRSGKVKLS